MLQNFWLLIKHECRLYVVEGYDSVTSVLFYVLTAILFVFGVASHVSSLPFIASGIIWVSVLLATLLSLDRLFQSDCDDGSLEILWISSLPMELIFLAKIVTHWLITVVPLIVVTPLIAQMLQLESTRLDVLILSLILGTPSLSLIGGVGAALTVGARHSGLLLALIILPLYVPVLIFGVSVVETTLYARSIQSHLFFLAGLLLAALSVTPWIGGAVLRHVLHS